MRDDPKMAGGVFGKGFIEPTTSPRIRKPEAGTVHARTRYNNQVHSSYRAPVERAVAQLKTADPFHRLQKTPENVRILVPGAIGLYFFKEFSHNPQVPYGSGRQKADYSRLSPRSFDPSRSHGRCRR